MPPNKSPARLTRPHVGLIPKTPLSDEGMRIDPPPSAPMPIGTSPVATATPVPVDEPPATCPGSCGFRGIVRCGLKPSGVMPSSVIGVVPTMIAPASRRRDTIVASSFCGAPSKYVVPPLAGSPRTRVCSLMTTQTPSSGPFGAPTR